MCTVPFVHRSPSLEGMGRVKFRTLKELYNGSEAVSSPTQVKLESKEGFHLQSTVIRDDGSSSLSVPFTIQREEKSRKCNLRATWCSSCMHCERVAAIMGVGTGDFTNKASKENKASQCSSNYGVLFSHSLSSACDCRQRTSSEASNILSVSSSHDPFSENAQSQATLRDSDPCEDIELLLNIRAQPAGESGDSSKGLIKFDNERLSNQFEKNKSIDIPVDNISCFSRSDSINLTIAGTYFDKVDHNNHDVQNFTQKPSLEGVVGSNESDQSRFSSLKDCFACAISPKGKQFECSGEQVESSPARVATSEFSDPIDGVYNYPTFRKADPHLNCEDSAIETESHLYRKKHLQTSLAVIENSSMRGQSQPVGPRRLSDLMEDEVRVCDICGDVGREELLAICSKCTDGAEHIYCLHVKLDKVPEGDWMCEECILRTSKDKPVQDKVELEEAAKILEGCLECQKSGSSVNLESRSSLKFKSRSSSAGRTGTNDVGYTSLLSAKRPAAPLKAQTAKKARAIGMSAVLPRSSKPCNNSLLHRDSSYKNIQKGKIKATKEITSVPQLSCIPLEKANAPSSCGEQVGTLKSELDKKRRELETRVIYPKASNRGNQSLLSREVPSKTLEKVKIEAAHSVSSAKQSYYGTQKKAELPSILDDKSPKSCSRTEISRDKYSLLMSRSSIAADLKLKGQLAKGSQLKSRSSNAADLKLKGQLAEGGSLQKQMVARNSYFVDNRNGMDARILSKSLSFNSVSSDKLKATSSEVLLTNAACSEALKKSSHATETKAVKGKNMSELHKSAMGSQASELRAKSEKETMFYGEPLVSGSNCHKHDPVKSCGQSNYRLKPTSNITHKPASDEGSYQRNFLQFKAPIFYQGFVIPKSDYIWLGKFQLHNSEGLASSCDGIQAHLSTFASPKVLEVVDKLPEIIILEELPRLRTWPSQFIERQAAEENISLYFFAKDLDSYQISYRRLLECMTKNDLALKGILDGVELLIFPSNLLPEKSQRWNKLLFLWGVLRGWKVDNSANMPISNSPKEKNRDSGKRWALDLNAYPQDGEDTAGVDEGGKCWSVDSCLGESNKFDCTGRRCSGDEVLVGGDGYSSGFSDARKVVDKGENKSQGVDIDLSLWPKSATRKDGVWMSSRTNEEVHRKPLMEVVEATGSLSLSLALPSSNEQNLETEEETKQDLLEWQAADILLSLSKSSIKI